MRKRSSIWSIMIISILMLSSLMISAPNGTHDTSDSIASSEYSLASTDTTVIFADDFEYDAFVPSPYGDYPGNVGILRPPGFTQGMTFGDDHFLHNYSRDCWYLSDYRSHSGSYSLWCAQYGLASWGYNDTAANSDIHRVDQEMISYYESYMTNLSDYDNITLSFWYWIQSSCPTDAWEVADHLQVHLFNGTSWMNGSEDYYWSVAGNKSWTHVTLKIPDDMKIIGFYYLRGLYNRPLFEGAYIDDVVLVGHRKPPASVLVGDTYIFSSSVGSPSAGPSHFTLTTNASWLSVSSSNATEVTISGVPTHKGLYSVSLKANDSLYATWKNWTVEVYDILEFDPPSAIGSIPFGELYWFNTSIEQNAFAAPNSFSLVTNASWLSISWSNDTQVNVSGTASASGNFTVSLTVNNSYSTAWKNWTVAVGPQPSSPPPPISNWWYVIITVVIAAVVLIFFLLRRKRSTETTTITSEQRQQSP